MASYVSIFLFFFFLALSSSFQTHARDSKFFSKVAKPTKKTSLDSVSDPPAISPSPEPEVVERGYGLYGSEPYEFTPTTKKSTNTLILGEEKYVPADELSSNQFYGNGNEYQYPPTTGNPTKTDVVGEQKFVAPQELSNNDVNGNENGLSDLRFLENEKYSFKGNEGNGFGTQKQGMNENNYDDGNFEEEENGMNRGSEMYGNGNVGKKKGMSDTRYLENGKYYYDIKGEEGPRGEQNTQFNANNFENENFEEQNHGMDRYAQRNRNGNEYVKVKQGMSDTRFLENGKYYYDINGEGAKEEQNTHFNANHFENENFEKENHGMDRYAQRNRNRNGNGYVTEKQGMSDTRFLENGKYFYDINSEKGNSEELKHSQFNDNNEYVEDEKHGMSDTRFQENGKYFYDVKNENNNVHGNEGFLNTNNGYGNEEEVNEGNNGYVKEGRGGYNNNGINKKFPNHEYVTEERKGSYGSRKKLPNTYDTMEEYDREQGYIDPKDAYVP